MVRHTLQVLGPKVLASRMVRDYAVEYYAPAAAACHQVIDDDFAGARSVAAYRRKVEAAWPSVKVVQVDSSGLPDTPEIGSTLSLRAQVQLGGLAADDVAVQAVLGRVSGDDDLSEITTVPDEPRRLRVGQRGVRRRHAAAVVRRGRIHGAGAAAQRSAGHAGGVRVGQRAVRVRACCATEGTPDVRFRT